MADNLDTILEEQTVAAVSGCDRGPVSKRAAKPNSLYVMDKRDRKLEPKGAQSIGRTKKSY
jgi:hypothetical protein